MGQTSSKQAASKVFEPSVVKVDPEFRKELESLPETDVVRRLYTDKYIEDRIAERLYKDRIAAENDFKEKEKLIPEISDDRLGGASSSEMRKKVSELHRELTSRPLRGSLDAEGKIAREKLVNCLIENKDKPLSCRVAFSEFQREISRIEKKVASASA